VPIYRAIYDGPPRWYGNTRTSKVYIAIHSTENSASAEAEADYAKRRADSTSSHYYIDQNSIVQSLDTDLRAFHAGSRPGNDRAIAYELTGRAAWSRSQWLGAVAWPLLVAQIRADCAAHNIVPRDLSVAQIQAGSLTGIITHNEMRLAWGGTDHTDPGPNFPMDHLIGLLLEGDDVTREELQAAIREVLGETPPIGGLAGDTLPEGWQGSRDRLLAYAAMTAAPISRGRFAADVWSHATAGQVLAGQAAILAKLAGEDVAAAAAAAVRAEFAALGPALAGELADVPAERIEAALRAVLGSLDEG
jgi:hypothetical protein